MVSLGGIGGGVAFNKEEFVEIVTRGLNSHKHTGISVNRWLAGKNELE